MLIENAGKYVNNAVEVVDTYNREVLLSELQYQIMLNFHFPCQSPHVLQSRVWLVSGVFMNRPYKLTLLFVQARFQESTFIWPICCELFGCLASCVQIGSDYRITFSFLFSKTTKGWRTLFLEVYC